MSAYRYWEQTSILIQKSLNDNSLTVYHTGIRRFREFLLEFNPTLSTPLTDADWCLFYAWLVERITPDSASNYLSHVAFMFECNGIPRPIWETLPLLTRAKKGSRKIQKAVRKRKQPVTYELGCKMIGTTLLHPDRVTRLSGFLIFIVILLLGICGWLRLGELIPQNAKKYHPEKIIRRGQVCFFGTAGMETYMRLWLFRSKGDTFSEGVPIFIPANPNNRLFCPVAWTKTLLRVTKTTTSSPTDPLFVFPNGTLVTKTPFIKWLRARLKKLHIDPTCYAGHSLRIGAAVSAARRGVSEDVIQKCGRWKSATYLRYIKYIPNSINALRNLIAQMGSIRD